jgi:tetratricopeptide (TPR) repeat protein
MADLLSRDLDGLQQIRAVDPNTVITRTHRMLGDAKLVAAGAGALSRELGAGLYVAGTVTVIGDRLRIQAAMFAPHGDSMRSPAASSDSGAVASAVVEGDTTQLFTMVDRLAADLVARRYGGPGSRLAQTAASTTGSLAALRQYLDAESHLRNTRFDKASAGYERAIAADSGFALAHYRLAVALGLQGDYWRAVPIAQHALALSQRLSGRERRLLEAYAALVRGQADSAERRYRAILAEYPDDLEARFLLGRTLFYYNPSRGREVAEAKPVFDAVLAADPEFLCPI